jgi:hypothetical protein
MALTYINNDHKNKTSVAIPSLKKFEYNFTFCRLSLVHVEIAHIGFKILKKYNYSYLILNKDTPPHYWLLNFILISLYSNFL